MVSLSILPGRSNLRVKDRNFKVDGSYIRKIPQPGFYWQYIACRAIYLNNPGSTQANLPKFDLVWASCCLYINLRYFINYTLNSSVYELVIRIKVLPCNAFFPQYIFYYRPSINYLLNLGQTTSPFNHKSVVFCNPSCFAFACYLDNVSWLCSQFYNIGVCGKYVWKLLQRCMIFS